MSVEHLSDATRLSPTVSRQRRRLLLGSAAVVLSGAIGFPAVVRAAGERKPNIIRIASPDLSAGPKSFAGISTLALTHIRGSLEQQFEKEGISVQWSFFKGAGPAVNEAFANRQIDFAYLGDLASIIGRANRLETRYLVAVRGSNTYLGVSSDSSIVKLKDLQGKRVAVFRGTADQLALGRSLAEVGLSERDLQIINLDWVAARAALSAGQVDAVWQGAALLTLRDRGLIKVPVSTKQAKNKQVTTQAGLVGTQSFISEYPELTQRLVDVLVGDARWAADPVNRVELERLFAEQGSLPPALVHNEFEGDDLAFRFNPRLDEFVVTSYAGSVAAAKNLGLIRHDYDVQSWFAPQFVESAIKNSGQSGFWRSYDEQGSPKSV